MKRFMLMEFSCAVTSEKLETSKVVTLNQSKISHNFSYLTTDSWPQIFTQYKTRGIYLPMHVV